MDVEHGAEQWECTCEARFDLRNDTIPDVVVSGLGNSCMQTRRTDWTLAVINFLLNGERMEWILLDSVGSTTRIYSSGTRSGL